MGSGHNASGNMGEVRHLVQLNKSRMRSNSARREIFTS